MNYIGSKYSLIPEIERVLNEKSVPAGGIALDLFAGTGIVAQYLKRRGHIAYANDWQYYSYLTCVAFIEHNELPSFGTLMKDSHWGKKISQCPLSPNISICSTRKNPSIGFNNSVFPVLSYLTHLPGKAGRFYDAYCEGGESGRLYFSRENGLRIQAIRDLIEQWSDDELISPNEKAWLVASLIEGADRVANTASIYGAYLKHVKRSAQKSLQLCIMDPVSSLHDDRQHRAFCMDSETLLGELNGTPLQLVYIDPPYNSRQYNANYHILETIARWDLDYLQPRGVTGLRSLGENKSDYCRKGRVEGAFRRLFGLINAEYVLFSYNNEGLLSREELEAIFGEYCSAVDFQEIPYRRFRADNDGDNRVYKGDTTVEYLILGKMRRRGEQLAADNELQSALCG